MRTAFLLCMDQYLTRKSPDHFLGTLDIIAVAMTIAQDFSQCAFHIIWRNVFMGKNGIQSHLHAEFSLPIEAELS